MQATKAGAKNVKMPLEKVQSTKIKKATIT